MSSRRRRGAQADPQPLPGAQEHVGVRPKPSSPRSRSVLEYEDADVLLDQAAEATETHHGLGQRAHTRRRRQRRKDKRLMAKQVAQGSNTAQCQPRRDASDASGDGSDDRDDDAQQLLAHLHQLHVESNAGGAGPGMDAHAVARHPCQAWTQVAKATQQRRCPVCLVWFGAGDMVRTLQPCAHVFHIPCIDTWLEGHTTCPSCRISLCTS